MNDLKLTECSSLNNELEYNLKRRHPERDELYAEYAQRSEQLRDEVDWQCLRYGQPERCTLDWFPAPQPEGAPLLVFIHGGYWRGGDKRIFSFLAEGFRQEGLSVALVGYELAPIVTVATIGQQVRAAIRHLMSQQQLLGFDPSRVTLSGHSAGGHLAALSSAYPEEIGVGGQALRVVALSGVYNLLPVMQTSLREEIGLTTEVASDVSLPNGRTMGAGKYLILAGELETDAFIGQSRTFHEALIQAGNTSDFKLVPGCTHFDIFKPLANSEDQIHQQVLEISRAH